MSDNEYLYYKGTHPSWQYKGELKFDAAYENCVEKFCDPRNTVNHRVYIGEKQNQRQICCFCSRPSPDVSFSKDAHALPACLGNRIFFTREECDDCNDRFGREFENHLANMTEAERALLQIPSRGAPPKWTMEGYTSQFKRHPKTGVVMMSGGPDDLVKIKFDETRNRVDLEGPLRPYEPVRAVKSVLHSAWLFLTHEQRRKHGYLKEIIDDQLVILPFVFMSGYIPDRPPSRIELRIFEKKILDENIPDLIVMLYIGHSLILWSSPDVQSQRYLPFPFPAIRALAKAPPPTLSTTHLDRLNHISKKRTVRFALTSEKMEKIEGDPANFMATKAESEKEIFPRKVHMLLKTDTVENLLESFYLKVKNAGSSDLKIVLSAKDHACDFIITLRPKTFRDRNADLTFNFVPEGKPIKNVLQAISFLQHLGVGSSTLSIKDQGGNGVFSFESMKLDALIDLSREKLLAERIWELSRYVGRDFTYPRKVTDDEISELMNALDVFNENPQSTVNGSFSFTLEKKKADTDQLDKFLNGEGSLTITQQSRQLILLGVPFELPSHKITILFCKEIESADEGETFRISGRYRGAKYERMQL